MFNVITLIKTIKRKIIHSINLLQSIKNLIQGLITYQKTEENSDLAYMGMLNLYCATQGFSNVLLTSYIKSSFPPYQFDHAQGVLGDLKSEGLKEIISELENNDYYVFKNLLPPDICERLKGFALTQETDIRPPVNPTPESSIFNPEKPIATTYWLREKDLICNPDIQFLMSDFSLLTVAQFYLGSQPILDIVAMWWSTVFQDTACVESAQLYHFDFDRIKWLKFFIYLTDVTPENGPHCYIQGTHKAGKKPSALLERGYTRIPDSDLVNYYSSEQFIELTAPQGTIIAGDTLCFHKGKPLVKGHRLILELEFTNSLFGGQYQKVYLPVSSSINPDLADRYTHFPPIYYKYEIN